jgi:Ketol-acid reductoisomerase
MVIISSGPKVINDDTKKAMKEILDNIQSGNFANEFLDDCRQSNDGSGGPFMKSNMEINKKSSDRTRWRRAYIKDKIS